MHQIVERLVPRPGCYRARCVLALLLLAAPFSSLSEGAHAAAAEQPPSSTAISTGPASALIPGTDAAPVPPWMRVEATRIVSSAPRPPPPGAGWETVAWPDTWRAPERYRQGVLGWYRFPLGDAPADDSRWAVYLWRFSMNAQVWLNGHYLGSGGRFEEPVARNWNRPLLLDVPAGAWQPKGNVLHVRLRVYPGFGHLAPPLVGPRSELEPAWRARTLAQITLAQVACAIALMAATLGFVLWLVLREERSYGWFTLLCLAFAVYCLNQFIVDLPVPAEVWWPVTHIAIDWFAVCLVLFLHRLFNVRRATLERACIAYGALATLLYMFMDLPQLARWNAALHVVSFTLQLYCWTWVCLRAWRAFRAGRRDLESIGFAAILTALVGASMTDLVLGSVLVPMLWQSFSYSAQLVVPLLFLAIVVHLAFRMARSAQLMRVANVDLETRVATARAEIENAYAEREVLQRERAAAGERERSYRDLHDDLGARLLSLVYEAKDGRQATLARDALAQMRTIVTATKLEGASLEECAEEWRLETELRAETAGYLVTWHVEGDAALSGDERFQLERVLRELASNVVQHAKGSRMHFTLVAAGATLTVRCEDDGVGLAGERSAGGSDARMGHGMAGIHRRAADLGGSARWFTAEGGGLGCEVCIPLRA